MAGPEPQHERAPASHAEPEPAPASHAEPEPAPTGPTPRPGEQPVDALLRVLEQTARDAQDRALTMGDVLDRLGDASYALICILVSLPFLQPFNLGPFSALGGATFVLLGWQLFRGNRSPWVPRRLRAVSFSGRTWGRLLSVCRRIVGVFRRFTRTRYTEWTSGPRGHRTCGALLVLGGVLLSLPFPGLPFSSTIPALMILCVCIADLEEDGAFLVVALGFLALTLVYFAVILWGLLTAGDAAIDWVRDEF